MSSLTCAVFVYFIFILCHWITLNVLFMFLLHPTPFLNIVYLLFCCLQKAYLIWSGLFVLFCCINICCLNLFEIKTVISGERRSQLNWWEERFSSNISVVNNRGSCLTSRQLLPRIFWDYLLNQNLNTFVMSTNLTSASLETSHQTTATCDYTRKWELIRLWDGY